MNAHFEEIQKLYDAGNKSVIVLMNNGEKRELRLFISTIGRLCYFAKGKHKRGYPVSELAIDIKEILKVKTAKKEKSVKDSYIHELKMFKKAFSRVVHPNLWKDLQDGYKNFDIEEFEKILSNNEQSHYDCYEKLCEFIRPRNIRIITENKYKTTTIQSNKPKFFNSQYNACIANIGKQIENKESFSYYWQSNYDVSVSGKMCDDGIYRAWLSLEFRGCGNGHYYLLINKNTAVFSEDD